jgi:hypothetical protein
MRSRRAFWCSLALLATACSSPARPQSESTTVPVVETPLNQFEGTWAFSGKVTACTGLRNCFATLGGFDQDMRLRLHQAGSAIDGVLTNDIGVMTEVHGTADIGGRVTLTGSLPFAGPDDCPGGYSVTELTFSAGADQTGSRLKLVSDSPGLNCAPKHYIYDADITAMTRVSRDAAPQGLAGTWRGFMRSTSCPEAQCGKTGVWNIESLTFTESGGEFTTRLSVANMTVTTRLEGTSVVLTGESEWTDGPVHSTRRVTASSMQRDDLGRLTGSFVVHSETFENGTLKGSGEARVDLWRMAYTER